MAEADHSVKRRRLYWLVVAIAFCVAAVTFGVFISNRDQSSDEKQLQGVWVDGDFRLTITGYIAVMEGFGEPTEYYFRLRPGASPKRIILCLADRPTRPEWYILGMGFGPPVASYPETECRGIYELEGDRLRLRLPISGADFPKSFDPAIDVGAFEFRRP
jgi:hypothetical protein